MRIIKNSFIGKNVSNLDSEQNNNNKNKSRISGKLAQEISDGDKSAVNSLVKINYKWLLFIIRKKFPNSNNHEDILQDTFMLIIEHLTHGKIKQPKTIKSYMRTTAINIGFEYLRQDKKFKSSIDTNLIDEIENDDNDILADLIWKDKTNFVKQVIREMKIQRDQDILYNYYFEDESKSSICKKFTLSCEHFDRVLYRAKQRLKQLISKKDDNSKGSYLNTNVDIKTNKLTSKDTSYMKRNFITTFKLLYLCFDKLIKLNGVKL